VYVVPSKRFVYFFYRSAIESSLVYQFLKTMPKGGSLHLHDTAITSADWVVENITYREGLYMCKPEDAERPPLFTWLNSNDEVCIGMVIG
jgi:hypothetical protein